MQVTPPLDCPPGLSVHGTELRKDGRAFRIQGLSFFNAIFNPAFNQDNTSRGRWLDEFVEYGINTLRVWCQWDFTGAHKQFVDAAVEHTLFAPDGGLQGRYLDRLADLLTAAGQRGMVIELTYFTSEHAHNRREDSSLLGQWVSELTRWLKPFPNVLSQIWNERSSDIADLFGQAKDGDPRRLVTSSPGFPGDLGDDEQNRMLDVLTPHTTRKGDFWLEAPRQLEELAARFAKPVIDDEPARTGIQQFGGRPDSTPQQHILHIRDVRERTFHHIYHHDMFQCGYGHSATPPSGIPDPGFSDFHRPVFEFLRAMSKT
jgi:hypothetical protein